MLNRIRQHIDPDRRVRLTFTEQKNGCYLVRVVDDETGKTVLPRFVRTHAAGWAWAEQYFKVQGE